MKGQLFFELLFVAAALLGVYYFGSQMVADLVNDPAPAKFLSAAVAVVVPVGIAYTLIRQRGLPQSAIVELVRSLRRSGGNESS